MNDSNATALQSVQGRDFSHFDDIRIQVQAWRTQSGTQVRFVRRPELPMVDLMLYFNAGTSLDGDTSGVAALTLHMLDKGTTALDATQYASQIERLAAQVKTSIRLEHSSVSLRCLTAEQVLDPAIELFTSLVASPAFASAELAKMKGQLLPYQASRHTTPQLRTRLEANRYLFAGHPYGNPLGTTPEGIETTTVDQLVAFHRRAYSANNLCVAMVGDLTREQAEAIVQRITQALPQGWAAAQLPEVPQVASKTIHVELAGASNAMVLAIPMSVRPDDPDYPALVLASEVLGAGVDSRLLRELRLKRGLTYGASSRLTPHEAGGLLNIEWEIASAYITASQSLVAELLETFIAQGPTAAELELARNQFAGRFMSAVAGNQTLAALLAGAARHGQPANHTNLYIEQLQAVTPEAVRAVLQTRLEWSRRVFVSVGPTADQRPLPDLPSTDQ